jgi:hypothetical protein
MHRDPSSTTYPPLSPLRLINGRHDGTISTDMIFQLYQKMRSRDFLTMTFMHGNAARISRSQIGGCLHGRRPNDTDAVSLSVVTAGVMFDLGTISTLEGANMEIDTGREGMKAGSPTLLRGICLSLWVLLVISCKLPANRLYVFCAWTAAAFFMRFRR